MAAIKLILTIIFVIASIVLTVIVLMQEGKSAGLGAISGAAETYWGKNKGRSMEGTLEKLTRVLVIAFIVIAIVLIPISNKAESSATTDTQDTVSTDNGDIDTSNIISGASSEVSDSASDAEDSTVDVEESTEDIVSGEAAE